MKTENSTAGLVHSAVSVTNGHSRCKWTFNFYILETRLYILLKLFCTVCIKQVAISVVVYASVELCCI